VKSFSRRTTERLSAEALLPLAFLFTPDSVRFV
jgi:hypothetical protein